MNTVAPSPNLNVSPVLSVVIPLTRMAGKLGNLSTNLDRCLDLDIEIILVHDEQDNGTHTELETLVSRIPGAKCKIIRRTVYSPGLARNIGIGEATGRWISFWDADDLVDPQGYLRLIGQAEAQNASLGIGRIQTFSLNELETQTRRFNFSESLDELIYDLAYLPAFTRFTFRRESFKQLSFPEYLLGEDLVFLADLNFLDFKIAISDEIIYTYFIHQEFQATSRKNLTTQLVKSRSHLIKDFRLRSPMMKKYLLAQILRLNFSLIRSLSSPLQGVLISTTFLIREPKATIKSCRALLRRRNEFRIR